MKKHKHFKKSFLSLLFFFLLIGVIYPISTEARGLFEDTQNPIIFKPQIGIPGAYEKGESYELKSKNISYIGGMIKGFYDYGIGIAGILAVIMLMAGGLIWLTSAGSSEKITQAKNIMSGSVIGLVILFGSWMLLRTINPALVYFKITTISGIINITLNDGKDGIIDSVGSLPPDIEVKVKCLATNLNQACIDTDPPSMELDVNICRNLKPEEWDNTSCLPPNTRHCCAISQTISDELNAQCENKADRTRCNITATDNELNGVCQNNKCEGGPTCCQCYSTYISLGHYAYKSCRNDLSPKACREWCQDGNTLLGWAVYYYMGGSSKYNCSEGAFSQCTIK